MYRKLTSRKFWLTVGTVVTLLANKQYGEAVTVVMAYLGAETYLDKKAQVPVGEV